MACEFSRGPKDHYGCLLSNTTPTNPTRSRVNDSSPATWSARERRVITSKKRAAHTERTAQGESRSPVVKRPNHKRANRPFRFGKKEGYPGER